MIYTHTQTHICTHTHTYYIWDKKVIKMININSTISIVTLNVTGLNTPETVKWIQKQLYIVYKKMTLNMTQVKSKDIKI